MVGAATTFLGVMPMAFASNVIFRVFFKMFLVIIAFGVSLATGRPGVGSRLRSLWVTWMGSSIALCVSDGVTSDVGVEARSRRRGLS